MQNKDLIIIVLVALTVYLIYRQNQPNISDNSAEVKKLQQEVQHYQTLYQKRVERDLGATKTSFQAVQTADLPILTDQDQEILKKIQEFRTLVENADSHSLDRNQMNEIEKLTEQISQPSVKVIANQVITDSAHVLSHRNLLKKIGDKENELEQVRQKTSEQLRKINVLFDPNSINYKTIDFNGLYALLEKVKAERERERESKSRWPFSRSNIQPKEKTEKITNMKQTIQELNQKIINLQLENAEKLEEKDKEIEELEKKLRGK